MSTQKYEHLTPLARARLANTDEKAFRALKRDHGARLTALYTQLPQCKTLADHRRTMASIEALLTIPTGPEAA